MYQLLAMPFMSRSWWSEDYLGSGTTYKPLASPERRQRFPSYT
jgi:hypothetical protein